MGKNHFMSQSSAQMLPNFWFMSHDSGITYSLEGTPNFWMWLRVWNPSRKSGMRILDNSKDSDIFKSLKHLKA